MDEAFGMDAIGGIENDLAPFEHERGLVVVDHGRGEQAQPGVAVFLVVPAEESLRKSAAVLNAPEAIRQTPVDISWCGNWLSEYGLLLETCCELRLGNA